MARKVKQVIEQGIDKREVGYYSTPDFVAKYLTEEMLRINPHGKFVLDPAVGKEELLAYFYSAGKEIDSYDIIDYQCHNYSHFTKKDFIEVYKEFKADSFFGGEPDTKYDYIIANPPYNCHEVSYIRDNKAQLKKLFEVGVYNMYSMYLSAIIDMAKEGCLIGVIISDSFLTAAYHSKLREKIFSTCSIHQLILCPTKLFWSQKADVRTCILILQKGIKFQSTIKLSDRCSSIEEFRDKLNKQDLKEVNLRSIKLGCGSQILVDVDSSIINLFRVYPSLGSLYRCVTCISTGNDSKYLVAKPQKGYTIPFYKNPASRKFIAIEDAYLIDDFLNIHQWDKNFMVRNKDLLGKEGIACSSMGLPFSAVYLPCNAVTGVNPTIFPPVEDIDWLLAFLNSSLVTYLVRGVLIRSNMVTSGYVSSLPIISFSKNEKKSLAHISFEARNGILTSKEAVEAVDEVIYSKGILPEYVYTHIKYFCQNLGKTV